MYAEQDELHPLEVGSVREDFPVFAGDSPVAYLDSAASSQTPFCVIEAMDDLRQIDVNMLNIGQYLQPSRTNIPVQRYWHPDEFAELRERAMERGFIHCESGPLVRSSYHAGEQYDAMQHIEEYTYGEPGNNRER